MFSPYSARNAYAVYIQFFFSRNDEKERYESSHNNNHNTQPVIDNFSSCNENVEAG